jgi:hypothetical protein
MALRRKTREETVSEIPDASTVTLMRTRLTAAQAAPLSDAESVELVSSKVLTENAVTPPSSTYGAPPSTTSIRLVPLTDNEQSPAHAIVEAPTESIDGMMVGVACVKGTARKWVKILVRASEADAWSRDRTEMSR